MARPMVNFVTALRVLIDLTKADSDLRVDVLAVRLAIFGVEGFRDMKASWADKPFTSWYLPLEDDPLVGDVYARLEDDPLDVDVLYFCCESVEAPFRKFPRATQGERVVDYIQETLALLESSTICPAAFRFDPKRSKAAAKEISGGKTPPPEKHLLHGLTREQYFFHILRGPYALEIFSLLSTDMEDVSISSDHVFEKKMSITNSTDVYVSWHTVVSDRYVE